MTEQRVYLLGGPKHGTIETVPHGLPELRFPVYNPARVMLRIMDEEIAREIERLHKKATHAP